MDIMYKLYVVFAGKIRTVEHCNISRVYDRVIALERVFGKNKVYTHRMKQVYETDK